MIDVGTGRYTIRGHKYLIVKLKMEVFYFRLVSYG